MSGYCASSNDCNGTACNTSSHKCLLLKEIDTPCTYGSECISGKCLSGKCSDSSWECRSSSDCDYDYYCSGSSHKCLYQGTGSSGGGNGIGGGIIPTFPGGGITGTFIRNLSFSLSEGDVFTGKETTLRIVDENGNPVSGASVIITTQNGTKKTLITDNNGNVNLLIDTYGKVKIKIVKDYSTFEKEIDVKKGKLEIFVPDNIKSGKEFSLIVKDNNNNPLDANVLIFGANGEKVYDSTSVASSTSSVSSSTGSKITLKNAGKYTIEVRKDGYDTIKKEIYVSELKNIKIIIPDKIEFGKEYEAYVKDEDGNPVKAKVEVSLPDGSSKTYESDINGKLLFSVNSIGKIKISVSNNEYKGTSSEANVLGHINIRIITPGKLVWGKEFELEAIDDNGNLVNASASIITHEGVIKFPLNGKQKIKIESENASIVVEKEGYVSDVLNIGLEKGFDFRIVLILILLIVLIAVLFLSYKYMQYRKEIEIAEKEKEKKEETKKTAKITKESGSLMDIGTGKSLDDYIKQDGKI